MIQKNDIKVSVIVPVYDVEQYLCKCLDSLINQTLKDIEIICINDCSPDNSLAIIKEYAKKDDRVKIIDFKKNKGYAIAINAGLARAKGKYIGFVDSDDYVDLDFYEKLYKLAKNKNADIAKGNCKETDYETGLEKKENINKNIQKHKCYFYTYFWTAIYRRSMLTRHSIKFPTDNAVAEDVCFLNHTYYHYLRRENSLDSDFYSNEKVSSSIYCFSLILNRLNSSKVNKLHYSVVYKIFFYSTMNLLLRNLDLELHKKIVQSIIYFYHKCKFPKIFRLPKNIAKAIEKKDERLTFNLLEAWKESNFYPEIKINKIIAQNRKLYIWGMGIDCAWVKRQCESNGWKIAGFLDSNKKAGTISPTKILKQKIKNYFIIISSRKYGLEIAKTCRKAGLKKGVDFWRP